MKILRLQMVVLFTALLANGCARSPTLDVVGSYFPAWMMCIILGIVLTLVSRQVLIGFKLDVHLYPAPLVYFCLTVLWTLALWLVCFKN